MHKKFLKDLKPKAIIRSFSVEELMHKLAPLESYRDATMLLNRFLHRSEGSRFKETTFRDHIESSGKRISKAVEAIATDILNENGFDSKTGKPLNQRLLPVAITDPLFSSLEGNRELIEGIVENYNSKHEVQEQIPQQCLTYTGEFSTDNTVYISIDDVGVKKQKLKRGEGTSRDCRFVENTVIHIQYGKSTFLITCIGMDEAFRRLVAFLLSNGLMKDRRLVFLTDGASDIRHRIEDVFSFRPYSLYLDWLHLKKKCKEYISMAISGRLDAKKKIIKEFLRILFTGNVKGAKEYIIKQKIKNLDKLNEMLSYLDRKAPYIPCYAIRSLLGLRISSNRVEKANDLLVAQRQKHNGMSWSVDGSGALAAVRMVNANKGLDSWLRNEIVDFAMDFAA